MSFEQESKKLFVMKLIFVGIICLSLLNNILGDEGKGNNLNLKKNKFSVNQTVWRNNAMKNQCRAQFNVVGVKPTQCQN